MSSAASRAESPRLGAQALQNSNTTRAFEEFFNAGTAAP